ncbi:MAG: hypothetical protein JWR19_3726 [Pedosphaera sp.]|nr:hypothetical protein [Pedosphaera sp.]
MNKYCAKATGRMGRIAVGFFLAVLIGFVTPQYGFASNLLSNPGFDLDAPGHSPNVLGWQSYSPNAYNETDVTVAHSGSNYFKVYQSFNGIVNYNGVFQDYISGPGATYSADGWVYAKSTDTPAGQNAVWLEVTFRDAAGNILGLYRSAVITTNSLANGTFPKNQWNYMPVTNQFDLTTFQLAGSTPTLVAPPGTSFVRYQIVFQGDAANSGGSAYFDDLNLNQVAGAPYGDMNIVWSDEFNGSSIDHSIWTYDTGNNGWGNNELENYTSSTNNSFVANGYLHIVARNTSGFTSARLKSQGLFSPKYGRFEWRAKLPQGVGMWPALWMLGTNFTSINWPGCGEIDVTEANGTTPGTVQGSLHSGSDETAIYNFIGGDSVTNFHTYTLDWATNAILFYVDGHLYESQTNWSGPVASYPFPFNQPFFLLMNLAVGGNYVGNPTSAQINAGTTFPAEMLLDYVRIYNSTNPLQLAIEPTGANLLLSWPNDIVCHLQVQTNFSSALGSPWLPVTTVTNQLQITPGTGNAFYRLVSP